VSGVRSAAAALLVAAAGCHHGLPDPPAALARVQGVEPSGSGVSPSLREVSVTFSAPVSGDGLVDGRGMVVVPAASEKEAVKAVDSEEGAVGLSGAVPGSIALQDGGKRAVLTLSASLHPQVSYVVVIGSKLRSADGRGVLDAEGRERATVSPFQTAPAAGPAGKAVIVQVRADADTPESGGEYVLLENLGEGVLDLFGFRLEKHTTGGGVTSCVLGEGVVAQGMLALVVGGAYDGRYRTPEGTAVLTCGTKSLLGGLANDRFPSLRLVDPAGTEASTAGAAGGPVCAIALREDLDGADEAGNWVCVDSD
jgi:hypothetical protein